MSSAKSECLIQKCKDFSKFPRKAITFAEIPGRSLPTPSKTNEFPSFSVIVLKVYQFSQGS